MTDDRALLVLWPTGKCNLNCKYCYASVVKAKHEMAFETAKKAVDYFKDYRLKIQFAGGEPLLNFGLIEKVYEYVREMRYNASFQLQTNGTLITAELAKKLKQMRFSIGVSMDGLPEINELLRGQTADLVSGMKHLSHENVTVNINSVITSQNVDKMAELADLAMYFGNVAGIGLDLLRIAGSAKENADELKNATPEQIRHGVVSLQERCEYINKLTGMKLVVRSVSEAKMRLLAKEHSPESYTCNKNYCFASMGRSFVVLPDGEVYPCGSLIDDERYLMGNILEDRQLNIIALTPAESLTCNACKYYALCVGGCPSRLIVNGNLTPDNSLDCVLQQVSFQIAENLLNNIL